MTAGRTNLGRVNIAIFSAASAVAVAVVMVVTQQDDVANGDVDYRPVRKSRLAGGRSVHHGLAYYLTL